MMLTDTQVEFIRTEIDKSAISMQTLKDDLLDHFCCFIEDEMKKGESFENSYSKAMQEICPNGLYEIQQETIFLLNAKKILLMKKIIYSIGLLSSMSLSTGFIFKILRYPGANILFEGGFLAFVLVFVPLLAIERYKLHIGNILSERLKIILGASSAVITGLGVFMKIINMAGGNIVFVSGAFLFIVGFLPFLFFNMYRKAIQ